MMILKKEKGFSLVELMIVVAIIAILAAIAIPSFMRFAMKSKTSEATGNLSAIRTAEESYKAENDLYFTCAAAPTVFVADSTPDVWALPAVAGTGEFDFEQIGFAPDGNVRYQYAVAAGANNFTATATSDLDEDALPSLYTLTKPGPDYPRPVHSLDDY